MKKYIITITSLLPGVTYAQAGSDAYSLVNFLRELITDNLIPLFIALGLVYTIWSVVMFIAAEPESAEREEKKQQIFWGVIGLFVIMSIWGLIAVVGNSFNIFAGGTLTN